MALPLPKQLCPLVYPLEYHPVREVFIIGMETASIVVQGTNLQARIGSLELLADVILNGMCKPDVNSEVFEIVVATDVINDHQFIVPDEELIGD